MLSADVPSDTAKLFTGPIPITEVTEIRFVAIDPSGNFELGQGTFAPAPVTPPDAPTLGGSAAGQGSITARWSSTDTSITGYSVQLYDNTTDQPVGDPKEVTEKSYTFTGLTVDSPYSFTVKARNAGGYGPASPRSGALIPTAVTDRVTITQARFKRGDFRISGTGSQAGATISVRTGSATGPVIGTVRVAAGATPTASGTWELRLRSGAASNTKPGPHLGDLERQGHRRAVLGHHLDRLHHSTTA